MVSNVKLIFKLPIPMFSFFNRSITTVDEQLKNDFFSQYQNVYVTISIVFFKIIKIGYVLPSLP